MCVKPAVLKAGDNSTPRQLKNFVEGQAGTDGDLQNRFAIANSRQLKGLLSRFALCQNSPNTVNECRPRIDLDDFALVQFSYCDGYVISLFPKVIFKNETS